MLISPDAGRHGVRPPQSSLCPVLIDIRA